MACGADGGRSIGIEGDISWNVSDRVQVSTGASLNFDDDWTAWAANEGLVRNDDGLFIGEFSDTPDAFGKDDLFQLGLSGSEIDALLSGVGEFNGSVGIANGTGYYVPIFGSRDTRSFNLTTRANVIFSPKLSLQLYGQLFAARGRYDNFQLLANPDELRDFDYPKRRDFSFQSLQANVVLRW